MITTIDTLLFITLKSHTIRTLYYQFGDEIHFIQGKVETNVLNQVIQIF